MIEIFVNGKPLTLYSDTTINIEMNIKGKRIL